MVGFAVRSEHRNEEKKEPAKTMLHTPQTYATYTYA